MSLSVELVQDIIHLLLSSSPPRSPTPEKPGCSTKPTWDTLNALSLTSQSYRALAHEAWFRTLYTKSPEDLTFLRNSGWFPELGNKWTRHIHCVYSYSKLSFWNLSSFLRVSSVRLDWLSPSYTLLHADLATLPFLHLSSTIEHFDLRGRMWPEPGAIQRIANTPGFGCLKTLKMAQDAMWCGLCHACRLIRFKDRPMGLVYEGGLGLPVSSVLPGVEKKRLMMTYVDRLRACSSTT